MFRKYIVVAGCSFKFLQYVCKSEGQVALLDKFNVNRHFTDQSALNKKTISVRDEDGLICPP